MTNGSALEAQWSQLSSAQTLSSGRECHEDVDDITASTPLIRREIVRKSVDDVESSPSGISSIYKIGKTLGQGSFATVKQAEHRETGSQVAIKIMERDSENIEEREILALGRINHPNCVALLEIYESPNKTYLVTELVTGGTMLDRVIAMDHFSERDSATAMVDVFHAVQYIHEIGLVHRDLKLENLLYASDDPASPDYHTIKLVDFGFSKTFHHREMMKTACGSPGNVAPEVLDPQLEEGEGYGPEVDLWAVGVILYSMLCGFPPFYSESDAALIRMIRKGEYQFHSPYWDEISFGAKDLISNLLVVDPCRRFTCHQSLEHPWIKNAGDASSTKLHSSYRSFVLLRKLAIFDSMEPACLEDVSSRLQAITVPHGEYVVRAGEPGDAMYFINAGSVQVLVETVPVDVLGAGSFFGEVALTTSGERSADVLSLGATRSVRCDPQGSPLGRRRPDPAELFKLTREDFEAVADRYPALEDRLHEIGMARVRRACSPRSSPLRALRRCSSFSGEGLRRGSTMSAASGGEGEGGMRRCSTFPGDSAAFAHHLGNGDSPASGQWTAAGGRRASAVSPMVGQRRLSDLPSPAAFGRRKSELARSPSPAGLGRVNEPDSPVLRRMSEISASMLGQRRMSDLLIDEEDGEGSLRSWRTSESCHDGRSDAAGDDGEEEGVCLESLRFLWGAGPPQRNGSPLPHRSGSPKSRRSGTPSSPASHRSTSPISRGGGLSPARNRPE